jgi:hypothetical protein
MLLASPVFYRNSLKLNRPFTMNKRYLLTLFCATALSAPTANAYTAIALGTSAKNGPNYECWGSFHANGVSQTMIERRALANCILIGGTNPKIVLSIGKPGYFALAFSKEEKRGIIGWSGPLPSPEAATTEAIANCKKRGGKDPRIAALWLDGTFGQKR